MAIILSEQKKIELANAQKMGYLFENIMSEFFGWKKWQFATKRKLKCSEPVNKLFFYSIGRILLH